jgi:hypothetical protein
MSTALKPIPERVALLDELDLKSGGHAPPEEGCTHPEGCSEEICCWLLGLDWSDRSEEDAEKSPVIATFRRVLNDNLPDDLRQQLKDSLLWGIGTKGDGRDEDRAWMCADWAVRVALPMWLELAGTKDAAGELRALPELTGASIDDAQPLIDRVSNGAWDRRKNALNKLYDSVYAAVKAEFEKLNLPEAARAAEAAGAAEAARAARAAEAAGAAGAARAAEAAGAAGAARAARAAVYEEIRKVIAEEFEPVEKALFPSAIDLLKRMSELEPAG